MSQQINLFNPIFLKQKRYFSAVTMLQALGLILGGVAVLFGYASFHSASLIKQDAAIAGQLAATQAQLAKVNVDFGQRGKNQALEVEIKKIEVEVKALTQVFEILNRGEFGNTKGYSEYLRAFSRQSLDGLWLTGFSILGAGNEIELRGRVLQADLVPVFIARLKHEPVMQGKSFSSLEMQVRQLDPPAKDGAAAKLKTPVAVVEFNLQSSGIVKDPKDSTGAKN